eukprot:SAG11_NODE_31747_length_289_cov_1.089474_1_plen_55_part_01
MKLLQLLTRAGRSAIITLTYLVDGSYELKGDSYTREYTESAGGFEERRDRRLVAV